MEQEIRDLQIPLVHAWEFNLLLSGVTLEAEMVILFRPLVFFFIYNMSALYTCMFILNKMLSDLVYTMQLI